MNERNRFSPVSLTVKGPVLHLVLDTFFTDALFLKEPKHLGDRILLVRTSVKKVRIYHVAVAGISFGSYISAFYYLYDVYTEFLRKFPVTLVMRRYCHDRTRSVSHHYIVGDKDRDLFSVYGIDGTDTVKLNACLILDKLRTLKLCLLRALFPVLYDLIKVRQSVLILVNKRMLRSHYHECDTKERIATGRIYLKLFVYIL